MSCCRVVIALLMLSQIVMADEELTAEQVFERCCSEQLEHPVERVNYIWSSFDRVFRKQQRSNCELTYQGNGAFRLKLTPQSVGHSSANFREGYQYSATINAMEITSDEAGVTITSSGQTNHFECDTAVREELWLKKAGFSHFGVPPLCPGVIQQAEISMFDWSITARKPDTIWLKGIPKLSPENQIDVSSCEVIVMKASWRIQALRRIDRSGKREDVFSIKH